ncbi:MAG: hypothetical protein JXA60_01900 [Candidatus Coatesbacteria bacterium]|nr:hypothetical protein [Candidatus Coatesbacteria bacterium]
MSNREIFLKKFLLISIVFLTGMLLFIASSACTSTRAFYSLDVSLEKPKVSKTLAFSDENIDISFLLEKTCISFKIKNKTDEGIKIKWDDLSFITINGTSYRIIHSGVRYVKKDEPQFPTTIPPKMEISDLMIPAYNVYFVSGQNSYWNVYELFSFPAKEIEAKKMYEGKNFSIYMPLEIKGKKKEYTFSFKIDKVVVKKQ